MTFFRNLIRAWALALILVVLAIFSALLYGGFEVLLQRYADARLLGLAQTLAAIIEQRPDLLSGSREQEIVPLQETDTDEAQHELREAAHSIVVLTPDGRIVWQGSNVVPRPPVSSELLETIRSGNPLYDTVSTVNGSPVRRLSLPIPARGEVRYILQAEASLGFAERALRNLLGLLAIVSAAMMAVAWLGSGWLARKVLGPIDVLSATAETVSGSALETRLNVDAPYREFHRLAQAFNAMLDRLQKVFEGQRRFVDHAAHEMQTPLTVLQGNIEVALQKARTAEEYREALLNNWEEVQRLVSLTRSLLTLARLSGDHSPVQPTSLALEPLLRELVEELMVLAEDYKLQLRLQADPVPSIQGDARWLKQAVINLLHNALRYTEPGGRVTVSLGVLGNEIRIAVEDTGQGIESDQLPHLFERFYRTDRARARDSGGTGLGLPIVKEIIEAHGGRITVESQVGIGSIFTLWLPVPHPH
ncbi:MAG: sensor histidine kinase [Nitrospiraceae bacterium]